MLPVLETRVVTVDPVKFDPAALDGPIEALRSGALVVIPTETVYGIAVNLDRPEALRRLRDLRGADVLPALHIGQSFHHDQE